ncbi:MAG: CbbQ/NirQ/NorQ/GpvN family protein [Burkholderiales bacterium]
MSALPTTTPADGPAALASYRIDSAPYYRPRGDEVALFEAAWQGRLPMMLKGPTGCGKTRFVEHMAWRLGRPLVTVACHEDLTAGDLAGRWLLDADGTRWQDGPLTLAARHGALCYLDEVVEARQDTTVLIHPLADTRRQLVLDRCGEVLTAHPDFMLVVSYNPGYQSLSKDLKTSTRQRFAALDFDYLDPADEAEVVARESGVDAATAQRLVALGARTRHLRGQGLEEGASTRMLVHAGALIARGIAPPRACRTAVALPLADGDDLRLALTQAVDAVFP